MSAPSNRHRSWTIVLAEDNDDHALLIETALRRAHPGEMTVRRARNGDEAVALVSEQAPDLLLLDLNMPGRSGHEVLERVKGEGGLRRIPVAVLTSSDRDEDIAQSYGLGGNHFITKPADPSELEARLRSLLRNLEELPPVRRGGGELGRPGVSAVDPEGVALRRHLPWVLFLLALAVLGVFGRCAGVL